MVMKNEICDSLSTDLNMFNLLQCISRYYKQCKYKKQLKNVFHNCILNISAIFIGNNSYRNIFLLFQFLRKLKLILVLLNESYPRVFQKLRAI